MVTVVSLAFRIASRKSKETGIVINRSDPRENQRSDSSGHSRVNQTQANHELGESASRERGNGGRTNYKYSFSGGMFLSSGTNTIFMQVSPELKSAIFY